MITVPERLADELEILRKLFDGFSNKVRVAMPGIVQSFNSTKQTITVRLAIREKITDAESRIVEDVEVPILLDVPIAVPRAGGFSLTLPVQEGDECLVVFGDNCFDAWYQSGGIQNQIDRRRHDLSDGFAILGVWSQPRKLSGYATDAAQLRSDDGNTHIEVKSGIVNVKAATVNLSDAASLYKLIDERMVTAFNSHTHPTAATGAPSVPTTPLVLANVATAKTKAG